MNQPIKVLYILGWGRSGTTIIDNLVGGIEGFFSTGELSAIWDEGFLHGHPCSCGVPVPACPVWSRVALAPSLEGAILERANLEEVVARTRRLTLERKTCRLLRTGAPATAKPELAAHLVLVSALYEAIAAATQAEVIVDSSKVPSAAALLPFLPNVDPYFLHVVRDPRAAAYSWQRNRFQDGAQGPRPMPRRGAGNSTARWLARNLLSEGVIHRHGRGRTLAVRYEDFVVDPARHMRQVITLVGQQGATLPELDHTTVCLGENHAVSGNPSRFRSDRIALQLDTQWQSEQSLRDRIVSTSVALPALRRYRYPLWV